MSARHSTPRPPSAAPLDDLLGTVLASPPPPLPAPRGATVGRLVGIDPQGVPLVDVPGVQPALPRHARATVALDADAVGRAVVLLFEEDDPERPIIVGVVRLPSPAAGAGRTEVVLDGERLVFNAEREIVLRCGAASITLTRAGKVLIRGEYVLSRSAGVNRIQGGSVQIN